MSFGTTIHVGDVFDALAGMPDESVQCVVTSPPYWGLRDYGVVGQLGLERTLGEHIETMVRVFREVRRVLRKDGTLWLNYGDSYATTPNGRAAADIVGDDRSFRDKPFSTVGAIYDPAGGGKGGGYRGNNRQDPTIPVSGRIVGSGALKPKDLCGIPWRVALALQDDGWWLRQDIIWQKPNPMPESIRDRFTKAHEYLFLLTKSPRYYFDAEAVKEDCSENTHDRVSTKMPDGWNTGPGGHGSYHPLGREKGKRVAAGAGIKDNVSFATATAGRVTKRNKRSVWTIGTEPYSGAHFATFPTALVEPCVLAGSREGDLVMDPFAGAGTVGLVANRLKRNAILVELNPDYAEMAKWRLQGIFHRVEVVTALGGQGARALKPPEAVPVAPAPVQAIQPPLEPDYDIPDFLLRKPYDGDADFGASYDYCLAAVRERWAGGGEPWRPK